MNRAVELYKSWGDTQGQFYIATKGVLYYLALLGAYFCTKKSSYFNNRQFYFHLTLHKATK